MFFLFNKDLSILPPLFLIGGLIAFFLGFWAGEHHAKKESLGCSQPKITIDR
jgi:hypothetical protein